MPGASISHFIVKVTRNESGKNQKGNLSLGEFWRRIWKGRLTIWIQSKVSCDFLQNFFHFSFVFVNFIVFVIFKTNLIKIVELNQTMKY